MAITTVVGASGQHLTVTVNGSAAQNLANQYASAVSNFNGQGSLSSYDLAPGVVSTSGSAVQGIVSTGGAYQFTGNISYIAAGSYAYDGKNDSSYSLRNPVSLDLTASTASSVNLLTGDFGGVTVFAGNQSGSFVGGVGNNAFIGSGRTGAWDISTGNGNSTILGSNGTSTIADGLGQNLIFLGSGSNKVTSVGQDVIYGTSGKDSVTLLGGSSIVVLQNGAYVADSSTGNLVTVGNSSTIIGGSSSTYFTTGSAGKFIGGTSDTISAAGDLTLDHGINNHISVGGSLQFLDGTGSTTITAGTATVWGSTGLTANFNGTSSGTSLFIGDQANNGDRSNVAGQSFNASSSHGSLVAWAGDNQTITGGSASDTLIGTTGNSTLAGGSGAGNVFEFINGYANGNYTIADFGSAAGNLVGLNRYHMSQADLSNVLKNATVSGGNTTIQLSDNSKITFLNTTKLDNSEFGLWGQ